MIKKTIFISYSHANKNIVHKVADKLKEVYTVWIDRDNLKAGDDQDMEISNGINSASLFLTFISDKYCDSKACREEFALAKKKEKIMLLIMLARDASNGIDLTIAKLTTFYAFKAPNVFEPWSEGLYQNLLSNILDITQDVETIKKFKNLNLQYYI